MGVSEQDDSNGSDNDLEPETVELYEQYFDEVMSDDFDNLVEYYNNRNCSIRIDCEELEEYDKDMLRHFENLPDDARNHAHRAYVNCAVKARDRAPDHIANEDSHPESDFEKGYVRFENYEQSDIREIRAEDLNKPISIKGVVSKRTDVNPRLTNAVFSCRWCGTVQDRDLPQHEGGSLLEPHDCDIEQCNSSSFDVKYDEEETNFVDRQAIRLQERPEGLSGGERPQEIEVRFEGDITGDLNAGDRVTITGILRAEEKGDNGGVIHDKYIEGLCFNHEETDFEDIELDEDDAKEIREMVAQYNDPVNAVIRSLAPSIHGYNIQKTAIALQLFGGTKKDLPDGSRVRGDIHILLIGDPGTGKSQILQYVEDIAPRSVYSSGKGTSAAGLTAAAVRDDFGDGNEWTLEAGALVLADKGLAAIDELDKMTPEDRSSMHQALEQQEISVAKAGINATLKSRCSLLGAANPKYGRFDPYEPVGNQIDLEPALISRFDLIFTILDEPDEDHDSNLADHILNSNQIGQITSNLEVGEELSDEQKEQAAEIEPVIEPDMLRKYIAYAKREISPTMNEDTKKRIKKFYTDFRHMDHEDDNDDSPVAITPRQLEAAVRLSEACARIKLNDTVQEEDAKLAVQILSSSLKDVGYDPETGDFDVDMITSGTSNRQRNEIKNVRKAIDVLQEEGDYEGGVPTEDIIEKVSGMDKRDIEKRLQRLKSDGELYRPGGDDWDTV